MPPLALPLSVGAGMGGGRQLREMGLPMPLPSSGAGISGPSMLLRADAARSCAAARTAAKLLLPPALASRLAEAGWATPPPTELLLELRPRLSGRAGDSRPAMMCGESGAGATAGDGDQREWASSLPGTKGAMPCDEQSAHRPRGRVRQRSRALAVAGLPASQDPGLRDRQAPHPHPRACLHRRWRRHAAGSGSCCPIPLPLPAPVRPRAAPPGLPRCLLPGQHPRPAPRARGRAQATAPAAVPAQQPGAPAARRPAAQPLRGRRVLQPWHQHQQRQGQLPPRRQPAGSPGCCCCLQRRQGCWPGCQRRRAPKAWAAASFWLPAGRRWGQAACH